MPEPIDEAPQLNLRLIAVIFGLGTVATIALGFYALHEIGVDNALEWFAPYWERLKEAPPIVFFGAMSILTVFPVPLTPFYVTAGTLYGVIPSLLWIPPAMMLNNLIAHSITKGVLRPWLQSIVAKRGVSIPTLETKRDQTIFIVMVRITPGIPYFMQSVILGLAGVDRLRFLILSISVHMIYVVGFVVLGRSAFDGNFGVAIGAIALIIFVSVGARFVKRWLERSSDSEAVRSIDSAQ
jgi:uncharacterized membrane protein YdjX (TVP38/TMEM64 family)